VQISSSGNGAYEQQCTEAAAAEKTKAWHNKQLQSSTKRQLAKKNGKK